MLLTPEAHSSRPHDRKATEASTELKAKQNAQPEDQEARTTCWVRAKRLGPRLSSAQELQDRGQGLTHLGPHFPICKLRAQVPVSPSGPPQPPPSAFSLWDAGGRVYQPCRALGSSQGVGFRTQGPGRKDGKERTAAGGTLRVPGPQKAGRRCLQLLLLSLAAGGGKFREPGQLMQAGT